jgi:hypothetical protein
VKKTLITMGIKSKIGRKHNLSIGDAASWPVAAAIRHFRGI